MKKLMVTLVGAAACVSSAFAELPVGVDFGTWTGDFPGADASWIVPQDTATISEETWTTYNSTDNGLPEQHKLATASKSLKVNSPSAEVVYAPLGSTQTAGIYYDSLVKFTVYDYGDEPTLGGTDKLGVYLQRIADADDADIHMYVLAGKVESGAPTKYAYDCGKIAFAEGDWVRLTIKSIAGINGSALPGFVVFVNKSPVKCADSKGDDAFLATLVAQAQAWNNVNELFPSAANDRYLSAVAFKGQGNTDLISFTDKAPAFAADKNTYLVSWDAVKDNITSITIGTETLEGDALAAGSKLFVAEGAYPKINISWIGKEKFCNGGKQNQQTGKDTPVTVDAGDVKAAVATFAGEKYAALTGEDSAVAAANDAKADGTLTLLEKATEAITLGVSKEVVITLDLNGHETVGVTAYNQSVIVIDDQSTDANGIINGVIGGGMGSEIKVKAGKIVVDGNDPLNNKVKAFDESKKFVKNSGYWELANKETWTVAVDATLGDHVTEITANPTSLREDAADKTVTLTATFETGYELDYFTIDGVKYEGGSTFQLAKSVTVNAVAKSSTIPVTLSVTLERTEITEGDAIPTFTVKDGQDVADPAKYTAAWDPSEPTTESKAGEYTLTVTPKVPYTGDPASATLTIKEKAAPVIDPTNPEKPAVVKADDEDAAKAAVKISVPDDVKAAVGEEAYQTYFVKSATSNGDGTWNVTAALNDTVIESGATAAELAGKFDEITKEGVTVENAKPGLYYSVVEGQALTGREEGPRTLATSEGVTIKATKFDNSGFYQIKVSTTDTKVGD